MRITLNSQELLQTVRRHMEREEKLELDSVWVTTLVGPLRQISEDLKNESDFGSPVRGVVIRLDQLIDRIDKDLQQVLETEQFDETPSRESVYP
jgi:hypothetical protein